MSKSTVIRLFVGAIVAVAIGLIIALAAIVTALANGAVTIGGSAVLTVNGGAIAGILGWLVLAALAIGVGAVAAIASWIGALLNTVQLEDKTWFIALLVLGLISLGWVAMAAYIFAGPDATKEGTRRAAIAATPGT